MLTTPPSVPTTLNPIEIIGVAMADAFLRHFRIANAESNDGYPEARLKKEIGEEDRSRIAGIYRELRKNGFYPVEMDGFGQIRWATALEDLVYGRLKKDLLDNPFTDIEAEKQKARGEFKQIGSPENQPIALAA